MRRTDSIVASVAVGSILCSALVCQAETEALPSMATREIAQQLHNDRWAYHAPVGMAAGIIDFHGPSMDGRGGTKGILVGADPGWTSTGTVFQFDWSFSDSAFFGAIIVHPYGSGQIAIGLPSGFGADLNGNAWGQNSISLTRTPDYPSYLPTVGNTLYHVTSVLDGEGRYSMYMSGKLIAAGQAPDNPSPLDLLNGPGTNSETWQAFDDQYIRVPEGTGFSTPGVIDGFATTGLPDALSPGTAALIVGPSDYAGNHIDNVYFGHLVIVPEPNAALSAVVLLAGCLLSPLARSMYRRNAENGSSAIISRTAGRAG